MPYAEVDGVRVHYLEAGHDRGHEGGQGDRPALVLLHAFPLHAGMWAPQIEALAAGRRVVAPDLLGFGGSDAPDTMFRYTMAGYADLVAGLLDRLGLDRVVLGGLSMGGYVSFAFLRQYRERVAGLILADTRPGPDTTEVYERRTDQQDQVARVGTTALIEALLAGLLCEETRTQRSELVERVRALMANPVAGYIGALEAMKHRPNSTAELGAITVPALVVVGEHDSASPPDVARDMQERIPGAELAVLPGAGHLSNLEATGQFNAAVAGLLARV